jgi:DNA-binding CsgD family transcriptional regulator
MVWTPTSHIMLLYLMVAVLPGLISIGLLLLVYFKDTRKHLLFLTITVVLYTLVIVLGLIMLYGDLNLSINNYLYEFILSLIHGILILAVFTISKTIINYFGLNRRLVYVYLAGTITSLFCTYPAFYRDVYFLERAGFKYWLSNSCIILAQVSWFAILAFAYLKRGDFRKTAGKHLVLLAAAVPLLIVETVLPVTGTILSVLPFGLLFSPLIYFYICVLCIIFCTQYMLKTKLPVSIDGIQSEGIDFAALREHPSLKEISKREMDVIETLFEWHTNKEIAEKLYISEWTVKTHLQNIYQKLNVKNRRSVITRIREIGGM